MPLRVGFDLDGTVADMYDALHREGIKLFGEKVLRKAADRTAKPPSLADASGAAKASAAARTLQKEAQQKSAQPDDDAATNIPMQELHLTARQQMQLWDHVKKIENFWLTLPELEPGIIAGIAKRAGGGRGGGVFF